jgi:hypothetical protein
MTKLALESLEDKTLAYWNVSSTFQGRDSQLPKLNTMEAIDTLNKTLAVLNPARPLSSRVHLLATAVIDGGRRRKPKTTATVLHLANVRQA